MLWKSQSSLPMQLELLIAYGGALLVLFSLAVLLVRRSRARERRDQARLEKARTAALDLPSSLHPVIDADRCIKSLACVTACPEGDVIGIIDGRGTLIEGANCIGHGRCAAECPAEAIRLVLGTAERGVDIPPVSSDFESVVPGIYVVGELGGMGLIRNAVRQGVQAVRHLKTSLANRPAPPTVFERRGETPRTLDLLIVGAGPAGIAAALAAKSEGLDFLVVDQDVYGGTVANYPRAKVVMTEPVMLPLAGKIHRRVMQKEELLELWVRLREEHHLTVQEKTRVNDIAGHDGAFVARTTRAEIPCRKIVLAIGRRGTPRRLGVEGEELPHVIYRLEDPRPFAGKEVLVVGGGDSAAEAACALAEVGAVAALAYRGGSLNRCKPANRERVVHWVERGALRLYPESQPIKIAHERVQLRTREEDRFLSAEQLILCLGGTLPTALLKKVGIETIRLYGSPQ